MRAIVSLAVLVLSMATAAGAAQHAPVTTNYACTFGELYGSVKDILFATTDKGFVSSATLYFQPSWGNTESQITVQFPSKGAPVVTSFILAPNQKSISSTVNSAMKSGSCDAKRIAKRVRVIRKNISMNEILGALIDRLWVLEISPRPMLFVNLDATEYVLEVHGQDNVRFSTDDPASPIVKWMDEMRVAVSGQ